MTAPLPADRIVSDMLAKDRFSQWLGLEVVEVTPGSCTCRMKVRDDMVNGLGVVHGAVAFGLADSALAFACNGRGQVTVSIENGIRYVAPVRPGDVLTAAVTSGGESRRLGYYSGRVTREDGTVVALFTGTVYQTEKQHLTV